MSFRVNVQGFNDRRQRYCLVSGPFTVIDRLENLQVQNDEAIQLVQLAPHLEPIHFCWPHDLFRFYLIEMNTLLVPPTRESSASRYGPGTCA